jgi:hypothetical protein
MFTSLKGHRSVVFGFLSLIPLGCEIRPQETENAQTPMQSFGEGWKPQGSFVIEDELEARGFVWQDRELALCLGVLRYPGLETGPCYLAIVRLRPGWAPGIWTQQTGNANFAFMNELDEAHRGTALLKYSYVEDDKSEHVHVDGHQFSIANGRVFLVDARGQKISVQQLRGDISGLFPPDAPDFARLAARIDEIRQNEPLMQRFLVRRHPDADAAEDDPD